MRGLAAAVCTALVAALLTGVGPPAEASTVRVVAQQNASCSDAGPGTSATPYCTISAAAKAAGSGDTVSVQAGTYRETVTAPSGVKFQTSAGAQVVGTDPLDAATWSPTGGNAWTTQLSATASPTQVFKGSTALTKAASAGATTTNSWFFDFATHTLYVDLGGPAPTAGDGLTVVRNYGFLVRNASGVTILGFTLLQQGGAGVFLDTSTNSLVSGVTVSGSAAYGINDDERHLGHRHLGQGDEQRVHRDPPAQHLVELGQLLDRHRERQPRHQCAGREPDRTSTATSRRPISSRDPRRPPGST